MEYLHSRERIVALVEEIWRLDGTEYSKESERQQSKLISELVKGVLDPSVVNYMYFETPSLTAEQVADRALAYKPIILPDESGH